MEHESTRVRSRAWWAVVSLSLWLHGPAARADVVDEPPPNCPAGTQANTCHSGPFCAPIKCSTDAECTGGATCQDTKGCIGSIDCGGGDSMPVPTPTLSALCPDSSICGPGETCEAIKLCLPVVEPTTGASSDTGPTASGTAASDGGASGPATSDATGDTTGGSKGGCGGCSTDPEAASSALALLGLAWLLRRRRDRGVP